MSQEITFPRNKIKTRNCACCSSKHGPIKKECNTDYESNQCLRWHAGESQNSPNNNENCKHHGCPSHYYDDYHNQHQEDENYHTNGHYQQDEQYMKCGRNAGGGNKPLHSEQDYAGYYYENSPIDWQRPTRSRIVRKCTRCSNAACKNSMERQ